MRFIADMGIAQAAVSWLREEGHDAFHLRERGLQRLSDDEIIRLAVDEDRIILTHDLDFSRIVALSKKEQPSVISFRLFDMRSKSVILYIQEVIERFVDPLMRGCLISIREDGIRIRRLPIEE